MSMPARSNGETSARERPTSELVRSIALDVTTLARKEVELARREIVEAAVARAIGAAAFVVAGALGLLAIVFGGAAAASALESEFRPWAARLLVMAGFLALGAIAGLIGMARMSRPPIQPEETIRTVKEDVEWARAQLKR